MMNSYPLLFLACIFAGFALLKVPVIGFLAPLSPLITIVGVLTVLLFALVLIYHGLKCLAGKKKL